MGNRPAIACLALIGALGLAAPALPQETTAPCRLCSPETKSTEEKPSAPVTLDVEARLDFDRLILTGGGSGSAELGPDGSRNVSGSIAAISARAMVGEVLIRGEPGREVRIELPQSIELHGFSGGSIRLESIRSDLPPMPRLDANGRLNFRFGGIIHLSGDLDGEFRGDVRIDVQYF
jgi:hypothetical protein